MHRCRTATNRRVARRSRATPGRRSSYPLVTVVRVVRAAAPGRVASRRATCVVVPRARAHRRAVGLVVESELRMPRYQPMRRRRAPAGAEPSSSRPAEPNDVHSMFHLVLIMSSRLRGNECLPAGQSVQPTIVN